MSSKDVAKCSQAGWLPITTLPLHISLSRFWFYCMRLRKLSYV